MTSAEEQNYQQSQHTKAEGTATLRHQPLHLFEAWIAIFRAHGILGTKLLGEHRPERLQKSRSLLANSFCRPCAGVEEGSGGCADLLFRQADGAGERSNGSMRLAECATGTLSANGANPPEPES